MASPGGLLEACDYFRGLMSAFDPLWTFDGGNRPAIFTPKSGRIGGVDGVVAELLSSIGGRAARAVRHWRDRSPLGFNDAAKWHHVSVHSRPNAQPATTSLGQ